MGFAVAGLAGLLLAAVGFYVTTFAMAFARPPRPQRLLEAFLGEIVAGLQILSLWPLGLFARRVPVPAAPHPHPILLIHGLGLNRSCWFWLMRRLRGARLGPLYSINYNSLARVAHSAARIELFIEEICRESGCERVTVIAHSLGGLVARHYIEQRGGDARVEKLITLGTPHHGTRLARRATVPVIHDLTVKARVPSPDPSNYLSIWSTCDNLISPADSSRLAPPADNLVFDNLGHMALLTSPRVAQAIVSTLGG